jgi:hypothetical protein
MSYNKFCKVCYDAGKPEAVFTSHSVKEVRDGKPVCPTLSCTKCRKCNKLGHTVKYCLATTATSTPTAKKSQEPATKKKEEPATKKKEELTVSTSTNRFDILSSSEDDDFPHPPVLKRNEPIRSARRWIDYDSDSDLENSAMPF